MQRWRIYAEERAREQREAELDKGEGKTRSRQGCGVTALALISLAAFVPLLMSDRSDGQSAPVDNLLPVISLPTEHALDESTPGPTTFAVLPSRICGVERRVLSGVADRDRPKESLFTEPGRFQGALHES